MNAYTSPLVFGFNFSPWQAKRQEAYPAMVTIRLARAGAKRRPFYHVVVADSRSRRGGRFIERVGFFNPIATGNEERLRIDTARVDHSKASVRRRATRSRSCCVRNSGADRPRRRIRSKAADGGQRAPARRARQHRRTTRHPRLGEGPLRNRAAREHTPILAVAGRPGWPLVPDRRRRRAHAGARRDRATRRLRRSQGRERVRGCEIAVERSQLPEGRRASTTGPTSSGCGSSPPGVSISVRWCE